MKSKRGRGTSQKKQRVKKSVGRPKRVKNDSAPTYDISSSESDAEKEQDAAPTGRRNVSRKRGLLRDQSKTQNVPVAERASLSQPGPARSSDIHLVPVIKDLKVCAKTCKCPPPVTWYGCVYCSRVHNSREEAKLHRKSHFSPKNDSRKEGLHANDEDRLGDAKNESETKDVYETESVHRRTSSSDAEEPQESEGEGANPSTGRFKLIPNSRKTAADETVVIDISDDNENYFEEQNGLEELCDLD